jgi:hypothetical protein
VDFASEFFTEKFTGKNLNPIKNCLLVKLIVKKINPIKPHILQGKNLLVNFEIDFHKMKYYNQSYNYIAILISIKVFNFRNRQNRY